MNKDKLISIMYLNGDTQSSLARALGMSRGSLSAKINGKASFNQPEICAIKRKYSLKADEVEEIFFADEVSQKDTT